MKADIFNEPNDATLLSELEKEGNEEKDLENQSGIKTGHIVVLHAADQHDYSELLAFIRS